MKSTASPQTANPRGFLRLRDALRLAFVNLAGNRRRISLIIMTVVVLFAPMLSLAFLAQGIRNSILDTSALQTGGAVYIQTGFLADIYYGAEERVITSAPENADEILRERIAAHHGEIVGTITAARRSLGWDYDLISASAVEAFQNDTAPPLDANVITTTTDTTPPADTNATDDANAGLNTSTTNTLASPLPAITNSNLHLSDPALSVLATYPGTQTLFSLQGASAALGFFTDAISGTPSQTFLVDDNSPAIQSYRDQALADWRARCQQTYQSTCDYRPSLPELYVVRFINPRDAAAYQTTAGFDSLRYGYDTDADYQYLIADLFNNTLSVAGATTSAQFVIYIVMGAFLILALILVVTTLSHAADEDAATIALYRSLGASTRAVHLIYFLYLLLLCLFAALISFLVALLFASLIALIVATPFAASLQTFYQLSAPPTISCLGLDGFALLLLAAILLVAPLALLLTFHQSSAKHLSRKLKNEVT